MLSFTAVEGVTNSSQLSFNLATICSNKSLKRLCSNDYIGRKDTSSERHRIFAKLKVTPSLCCRLE